MAGITFSSGQSMTRPGVYNRYVQVSSATYEGASDGVAACALAAQWGEIGKVTELTSLKQARLAYGGDGGIFSQLFTGGAKTVLAVRAGAGGTKGAYALKDAQGASAVTITAKYPGARALNCTLTEASDGKRKFSISEAGAMLETREFAAGGNEAQTLAAVSSDYCDFALAAGYSGAGALAAVEAAALSAGTDPTVEASEYASALERLTAYTWNCVCVDSARPDVHAALHAFMTSASQDGHMGFGVIGEGIDVDFATRLSHARAFNDYGIIYVGGGWYDADGALIDGWRAAARVAAIVASVPSNQSITHKAVSGAVKCAEALTNAQYISCTQAGMLTFSMSPGALTWVENGITTLNAPSGEDDDGWMKIKRAKIRFELMDRANATIAPMIGNVSNDADGRAAVIQAIQGLLRAMISEGKILSDAAVCVDPDTPPTGDSASFIITVNDVDALEKVYFTYQFSFAQE